MRRSFAVLALGAVLGAASAAMAQQPSEAPPDLYQEALQSIAEGRNKDASAALSRVIDKEPLHAGAWLDLALIQCALGHSDEAERLFKAIEQRFAPPAGIMEMIVAARAKGCGKWKPQQSAWLMTGRGFDENVNQGADSSTYQVIIDGKPVDQDLSAAFRPQQDNYTSVSGEYVRDLTPNGSIGFAQFQWRRNDRLRQYDSTSVFAGIESPWRFGGWTVRTSAMLGVTSLGGEAFQRHLQLQARVGAPLALPFKTQFQLIGAVSHVAYLTLESFDANTAELKGQLSYRKDDLSASLTSGYLRDHAIAARSGGDRSGWQTSVQGRSLVGQRTTVELGYVYQSWYNVEPYAPGIIDTVRAQRTHVLRTALRYPVTNNHSVVLEARLVRNRENISAFQYNNRTLQLSWQWNGL